MRLEAIPFRLRIGVTGHRDLPNDPALLASVREAVAKARTLVPSSPYTPVRLAVFSPIAEGADRLVARAVLEDPGAILNVVLPLPRDDYLNDFASSNSRADFNALLEQAGTVVTLPETLTRDDAYVAVGEYVVTHSDVMIAVWNGMPPRGKGGTAEIVEMTRTARMPLFWIDSTTPFHIHEEHLPTSASSHQREYEGAEAQRLPLREAFHRLDKFNQDQVPDAPLAAAVAREQAALVAEAERVGLMKGTMEPCWSYLLPHYEKADMLAQRYQRRFTRFALGLFWLAATAVLVVAIQSQFAPNVPQLAVFEIICLIAILIINRLGKHERLHTRYLSYRFLAERLRARLYLALVGTGQAETHDTKWVAGEGSANAWVDAALAEIWRDCPMPPWSAGGDSAPLPALRQFIADTWLRDQIAYQIRAVRRFTTLHTRIERATYLFFGLALLVAVLHVMGIASEGTEARGTLFRMSWESTLIVLSLGLPTIFTALHGIEIQGEYERNASRARKIAHLLKGVAHNMESAPSLSALRLAAWQAEIVLLEEAQDWFALMCFHDVEIHV